VQSINQIALKHCTDCRPSVVTAGPRYGGSKCNVWEMWNGGTCFMWWT